MRLGEGVLGSHVEKRVSRTMQHIRKLIDGEDPDAAEAHLEALPGWAPRLGGLLLGLALFVSGQFHMFLYRKFTPVYTATQCGKQLPTLDDFSIGNNLIHVSMDIQVTCKNPNPYKIQILSSTPGGVFVGAGKSNLEVGKLTVMPGSSLEAMGEGQVHVRLSADITGPDADELLPHFIGDASIPITMKLQFKVGIDISFGMGPAFATAAPFSKACGLNMKGLFVTTWETPDKRAMSRLGPLVCRDSFQALRIPKVGDVEETGEDGEMMFTAAQVAPLEVYRGELIKNLSLGWAIMFSYILAFYVPIHLWFLGPRCPKRFRRWRSKATSALTIFSPAPTVHPSQHLEDQTRSLLVNGAGDQVLHPTDDLESPLVPLMGDLEEEAIPEAKPVALDGAGGASSSGSRSRSKRGSAPARQEEVEEAASTRAHSNDGSDPSAALPVEAAPAVGEAICIPARGRADSANAVADGDVPVLRHAASAGARPLAEATVGSASSDDMRGALSPRPAMPQLAPNLVEAATANGDED